MKTSAFELFYLVSFVSFSPANARGKPLPLGEKCKDDRECQSRQCVPQCGTDNKYCVEAMWFFERHGLEVPVCMDLVLANNFQKLHLNGGRQLGETCAADSNCNTRNCVPECDSPTVYRCMESTSFFSSHSKTKPECIKLDTALLLERTKIPTGSRNFGQSCLVDTDCASGNCLPFCESGDNDARCIEPNQSFINHAIEAPKCITRRMAFENVKHVLSGNLSDKDIINLVPRLKEVGALKDFEDEANTPYELVSLQASDNQQVENGLILHLKKGRQFGETCAVDSTCSSNNCIPECGSTDVFRCIEPKSFFSTYRVSMPKCIDPIVASALEKAKIPTGTRNFGQSCSEHYDCASGNCLSFCESVYNGARCIEPQQSFANYKLNIPKCISRKMAFDNVRHIFNGNLLNKDLMKIVPHMNDIGSLKVFEGGEANENEMFNAQQTANEVMPQAFGEMPNPQQTGSEVIPQAFGEMPNPQQTGSEVIPQAFGDEFLKSQSFENGIPPPNTFGFGNDIFKPQAFGKEVTETNFRNVLIDNEVSQSQASENDVSQLQFPQPIAQPQPSENDISQPQFPQPIVQPQAFENVGNDISQQQFPQPIAQPQGFEQISQPQISDNIGQRQLGETCAVDLNCITNNCVPECGSTAVYRCIESSNFFSFYKINLVPTCFKSDNAMLLERSKVATGTRNLGQFCLTHSECFSGNCLSFCSSVDKGSRCIEPKQSFINYSIEPPQCITRNMAIESIRQKISANLSDRDLFNLVSHLDGPSSHEESEGETKSPASSSAGFWKWWPSGFEY